MKLVSFCGDHCSLCPRYIATQNNDIQELNRLSELWYRLGFRATIESSEKMRCEGCQKHKACSYQINSCSQLTDIQNCGECSFFPCDKINIVFERTAQIAKNCTEKCTEAEYAQLHDAFLNKASTLNAIHQNKFGKK
jgi:hypothetical protein